MIRINKKLKISKDGRNKITEENKKKEITAKSDLTQLYSRSKKCVARKHVIAKLTNLKKGHQIFLPIVRHDKTFHTGSYSALPAMTWSIGCLAYNLLNGDRPFSTKQDVAEYRNLSFLKPLFDDATKQFLRDVLKRDADGRMSPKQLKSDAWMCDQFIDLYKETD